jgi:peptide/nickel transport system ATP-binding protein
VRTEAETDVVYAKQQASERDGVLLRVEDLQKHFAIRRGFFSRVVGHVRAVNGVSFDIRRGETLGLVGESGCGKTTMARVILRLLEPTAGQVHFDDVPIFSLGKKDMRAMRKRMQIIFQDPYGSLNPRLTVGSMISEAIRIHKLAQGDAVRGRVVDLLDRVGIPAEHMNRYPHEFSGGQRQRIGIARALAVAPDLIIADEPVSALDVSIQAQIIAVLKRMCRDHDAAVMLITHDMGVIAETADRVAVMYAGRLVEVGPVREVIRRPCHPYTVGLMGSIPTIHRRVPRLVQIDGVMPRLNEIPRGCAFHPRCPHAMDRCRTERPARMTVERAATACWLFDSSGGSGQEDRP